MDNSSKETKLLLPGDPAFYQTLGKTLPPDWQRVAQQHSGDYAFVVRPGDGGVMEAVSQDEATEYYNSGEYDERLQEVEAEDEIQDGWLKQLIATVCGTI